MVAIVKSQETRDRLHNLDLTLEKHQKIYMHALVHFIKCNEMDLNELGDFDLEKAAIARDHGDNKITVGVGFNMDRGQEARNEWYGVFKDRINFDDVYTKRYKLTEEEIDKLLIHSLKIRHNEIKKIYGNYWALLKPNERLMIQDAYYNGGSCLIGQSNGRDTIFFHNIKEYVKTNEIQYLHNSINEIKYRSNGGNNQSMKKGLQRRRDVEAIMLSSHNTPIYSKPNQQNIPFDPQATAIQMRAEIGKTIIPIDSYYDQAICVCQDVCVCSFKSQQNNPFKTRIDENLYIWRTQNDNSVRAAHAINEGKIFDKRYPPPATGNPLSPEAHGCRCYQDHKIPVWIEVIY